MSGLGSLGQRVVASDPGGRRLRGALQVLLGIALGAGGALGLFSLFGLPLTAVAPAIVTVMLSLLAIRTGGTGERLLTMGLMPLAATAGIALASFSDALGGTLTGELMFLVVIVVAVVLRRFGPRATALGTIGFMGFFLALFLQATPDLILPMGLASLCGAGGAMLSRFVLLREPPRVTWRRAVESLVARASTLRSEVDAYRGSGRSDRANKRVGSELMRLNDAAFGMGNGFQYVDELPETQADEVRGRVLDVDLAATELVAALRVGGDDPGSTVRYQRASAALDDAVEAVRIQPEATTGQGEGHGDTAEDAKSAEASQDSRQGEKAGKKADETASDEKTDGDEKTDDAKPARGPGENTRTAIQALLAAVVAMIVGNLVSPSQWFWAVVTSFLVFAGTASRGELAVKAWGRTVGTLAGVVAGVIVAALLDGLLPLQIITAVACIFLAIYFQPLSFAVMTFFVTTLLGVVYSLLGTFSTEVLVLRLVETAIGAAAGMLAGALVLPTRTRDVVRDNTATFLEAVAAFLTAVARSLRGEDRDDAEKNDAENAKDQEKDAGEDAARPTTEDVDSALQDLLTSAEPVGAVRFGDSRLRFQHWRALVWWLGASARRLARGVERIGPGLEREVADSLADLAEAVAQAASAAADADYDEARKRAAEAERIEVNRDGAEELVALLGAIRGALVDLSDLLGPRSRVAEEESPRATAG